MSHRILLTGVSGFLGGDLLARLQTHKIPYEKLYALVRTPEQAQKVKGYNAEPLEMDLESQDAITTVLTEHGITIVFYLIDAFGSQRQLRLIKALAKVKQRTGKAVHFLHTSGAKIFSESWASAPRDVIPLADDEPRLFDIVKDMATRPSTLQPAVQTNIQIIELAEELGVCSYIFAPCIVYGKGLGFGNPVSIQTVACVKAAMHARRVYSVDEGEPTWPVCHVEDNSTLYIALLGAMVEGKTVPHGKAGFYLAAAEDAPKWLDLYAGLAKGLKERDVIETPQVSRADEAALEAMAEGIGCESGQVALQLGGICHFTAVRGRKIGWKPQWSSSDAVRYMPQEAAFILANLGR